MMKVVEDLGPKYEGARVTVRNYQGRFVAMRKSSGGFSVIELAAPTGMRIHVLTRLTTMVEVVPLPEVKVGDPVLRATFFKPASRFYRQWVTGTVTEVARNKQDQIVYGVRWGDSLENVYYLRSQLEKLDQETRDAALALLTEQEEQHA